MKITWYGTASILIESGDTRLLFDPYMKELFKGTEPQEMHDARLAAFSAQTNILITHGHLDHLAHVKDIFQDRDCMVYLSRTPYKTLKKHKFPQEKMTLIAPGATLRFGDVTVNVYQGAHVKFDSRLICSILFSGRTWRHFFRAVSLGIRALKYPEKKETLFYDIRAEGKTVDIMGSAQLKDGETYPTGADVLILAHQGRSDIDEHNLALVHRLVPKRVLLDHYDDAFPPISSQIDTDRFCSLMEIPTQKLTEGETIEI